MAVDGGDLQAAGALHVHEEAVRRLDHALQLVHRLLRHGVRVQQVDVHGSCLSQQVCRQWYIELSLALLCLFTSVQTFIYPTMHTSSNTSMHATPTLHHPCPQCLPLPLALALAPANIHTPHVYLASRPTKLKKQRSRTTMHHAQPNRACTSRTHINTHTHVHTS